MEFKKITWVLLILAAALLPARAGGEEYSPYGNPYTVVTIGPVKVKAEVVSSPEKLSLGLGQRPGLPEGEGMLFVMPQLEVQTFCMRGMRFPLDLIWLLPGKVAGMANNIPAEYQGEIVSPVPVNYVLEVPAGFCEKYGIKVGDRARW